jgi:hypothetical protein
MMKMFLIVLLMATTLFAAKERYDLVNIKITNPKQIKTLESMGALIHEVKNGIARVEIPYKDFRKFENQGFEILKVLFPDITSYYALKEHRYHTYESFRDSLILFAQNYPNIAKVETLGFSVQNRAVLALKITENAQIRSARPRCLFEGCTHGNEKIGGEVAFALARYLITNYGSNPTVTNLVNTRENWVAPLVNPDGFVSSVRENANGVDVNRDYGYMWDEGWGSPGPFSQIESRNFGNFAENHQLTFWCSYHSGDEFIAYPWSYTPQVARDKAALDTLARHYHNYTRYPYDQGYQGMYEIHGSSKDLAYGVNGSTSWSCEVSLDYIPPASAIDSICDLNRPAQLYVVTEIGYGIHGIVTDSLTGEPLKTMVSVQPMDVPVYTDSLGDYHRFVLPGTYSMTVWANKYQAKTISNIIVPPDTFVSIDVALNPDTTAPIAGLEVTMVNDKDNDVIPAGTAWSLGLHDGRRYSMGVGGWIIIDMGQDVINGGGYDFTVYENDADPEGYQVYVGTNWNGPFTYIGADTGAASFDLSSGGVGIMRYVKIVDDGDGSQSSPTAGFDLDAIEATTYNAPALAVTGMIIIDTLGNNNGRFDPGETVELKLTLRNFGTLPALHTTGVLSSIDPYVEISDSIALFGDVLPGGTIINDSDLFVVSSSSQTPQEHVANFILHFTDTLGYVDSTQFSITIGQMVATDPIPDGPRTPPLFWAYDNVDTSYSPHPIYEWAEINTLGTRLTMTDDQTYTITLPSTFGPWKFYNQRYTQLSICSNGWVGPGSQTSTAYNNQHLPDPLGIDPNGMICANWDDLLVSNTEVGGVYHYHDITNHRFIIEYDSTPYWNSSIRDKYEIIIYDTTFLTNSSNNVIDVQYRSANRFNSSTVGIEDPSNQIAICCLSNDTLHRGCAPWVPGKVIRYTTNTTGISDITESLTENQLATKLSLFPNPFRNQLAINFSVFNPIQVKLNIYDYSGRLVRALSNNNTLKTGSHSIIWNGKDNKGKKVSSGVYFLRLETNQELKIIKTIKLR